MADKRRDKGDGSLRKLPSGKWEGRYSYLDREGNRRQPQVTANNWADAKTLLKQLIEEVEKEQSADAFKGFMGIPGRVEPNAMLLDEWLDAWISDILPNYADPATIESYFRNCEKHIKPALGKIPLQKVTTGDIQKLITKCRLECNHKPWTLNKIKMVISSAFSAAMEQRPPLVGLNPCAGVKTPSITHTEVRALTKEEQQVFVEVIKGSRFETFFLTALATGMRRGELIGLTWDCVDFKKQQISVKESVSRIRDPKTGKTSLQSGTTKTLASTRKVPIIESIAPVLQAHKAEQKEMRALAGSAWNEQNLVFCSAAGTWLEPRRIKTNLDDIIGDAGMEHFSFHSLRHTFATRMLEKEVPAKVVSEILGHKDVKTTLNIYSQVFDTTAHDQTAKLNDLFQDNITAEQDIEANRKSHYPQLRGYKKRAAKAKGGEAR